MRRREWREWLKRWDERDARWDERVARWDERDARWDARQTAREAETRRHRREWAELRERDRLDQRRRFDALDAAVENDKIVTREMLREIHENTAMLRDLRHGVQSTTEGLLRVLDRLDRGNGGSPAGA
jgi:hypothetical protein